MRRASAILLALGVTGLILSATLAGVDPPVVAAGNAPVNASARRPGDLSAHNSPTVVENPVDPDQVVVTNRLDGPGFSCALHVSTDGGETFAPVQVPQPDGRNPCFAPDAAFDAGGTLYLSFVTLSGLGNTPDALWVTSSSDLGKTFARPAKVAGELAFQPRLVADPRRARALHLTWLQARDVALLAFPDVGYPIVSAGSQDGGRTWSPPVMVSGASRERVVAPAPAIGPDGSLFVSYLDLLDDRLDYNGGHGGEGGPPYPGDWQLVLARSRDGGRSWSESIVEEAVVPAERFVVFLPPSPSIAVGPSGDIFIAFTDRRLGDPDVFLWRSSDGGETFSDPVRVNDTSEPDGSTQNLPKVGVAPDGRVDVVYYDRRSDDDDHMNDVSLRSSYDGGASFSDRVRLNDEAFDSRVGFGSERGLADLGSRLGLLSRESDAIAVWTDTRTGTEESHKQDLARAVVSFGPRPTLDAAGAFRLRIGGIALIVIGLGALTVSSTPRGISASASDA